MDLNKTIRPIEIPSGNQPAGIGYITIPDVDEVDREQFVEDCYRSHTVCIHGGVHYGIFYNVSIDKEVLKTIIFPKEKGGMGSPIVWVNIKPWNKPVIVAVLKYENDYYLNKEGELNNSRELDGNHIDMSAKAAKGSVDLTITTQAGINPKLRVKLISPDKNGEIDVYVKGKAKIHSTEETTIVSDKKILLHVVDEKTKNRAIIQYERDQGFTYLDEFENEINANSDMIEIKSKKINHSEGSEPMVLGNKLESLLEKLDDAIMKITVPTPLGPSGTPINTPEFQAIKQEIKTIKSQISNLD